MRKTWTNRPDWRGETVVVFGSGPSLTRDLADSLQGHKAIAVNYSHRLAPWADVLLILDANPALWADTYGFRGVQLCGVPSDDIDAFHVGGMYEHVRMSQTEVIEIRNSGLAAIRLAAGLGAKKIILAGFDPDRAGHFAGRPGSGKPLHPAVAVGLKQMIIELYAQGVTVEHAAAPVIAQSATVSAPAVAVSPVKRGRSRRKA